MERQTIMEQSTEPIQKHKIVTFSKNRNTTDDFVPRIAIDLASIDTIAQDRADKMTIITQKSGGKIKLSDPYEVVVRIWADWMNAQ